MRCARQREREMDFDVDDVVETLTPLESGVVSAENCWAMLTGETWSRKKSVLEVGISCARDSCTRPSAAA